MLTSQLTTHINAFWEQEILPALQDYIRIPNESPLFDPDWQAHGHMQRAVALVADWIRRQHIPGGTLEVLQDGDRTPLLLLDFPGSIPDTVLMYGHLDKQPPMVGWRDGLGPWTPYFDAEGRLYGRGAADDGYAVFTALATVQGAERPRPAAWADRHPDRMLGGKWLPSTCRTISTPTRRALAPRAW